MPSLSALSRIFDSFNCNQRLRHSSSNAFAPASWRRKNYKKHKKLRLPRKEKWRTNKQEKAFSHSPLREEKWKANGGYFLDQEEKTIEKRFLEKKWRVKRNIERDKKSKFFQTRRTRSRKSCGNWILFVQLLLFDNRTPRKEKHFRHFPWYLLG